MSNYANGGYIPSSGDRDDDRVPLYLDRGCVLPAGDEAFNDSTTAERILRWEPPAAPLSEGDDRV